MTRRIVLAIIAALLVGFAAGLTVRAATPRPASAPVAPLGWTAWPEADRGAPVMGVSSQPVVTEGPHRLPWPTPTPSGFVPSPGASRPATSARVAQRQRQQSEGLSSAGSSPAPSTTTGIASWFAAPTGTAAAGPALRRALGAHWRGMRVRVCAGSCVLVVLDDWCACRGRLIDLSAGSFARLAPLSAGLVTVTVLGR